MKKGRDTSTFRIDKLVITELLARVDQPALLKAIFDKARDICFGRCTQADFDAFCESLPCILWSPEDPTERNVTVRLANEEERVMIKVTRVVWRIVNRPDLRGHEELLHSCGRNGHHSTARGSCLNPAHLLRGTPEKRIELKLLRQAARTFGLTVMPDQMMRPSA